MFISKNFTYDELACPCCGDLLINEVFLKTLQEIRDRVGRPFFITSGFRCDEHNEKVGGAITSRHLKGFAVDISTNKWSSDDLHYLLFELCATTIQNYSTGVGIYPKHIHFDLRSGRDSAWINL